MVFLAFTAAMLMRRDGSPDWVGMHKPPILWLNTTLLLLSSLALERARRMLRTGDRARFNRWWTVGTGLGVLFLAGQWTAWQQLSAAGLYLGSSNLSASFFYILTASHAAHLIGGLAALLYVEVGALRLRLGPSKRTFIDVSAVFWHFLDVLWIYLMVLFYVFG